MYLEILWFTALMLGSYLPWPQHNFWFLNSVMWHCGSKVFPGGDCGLLRDCSEHFLFTVSLAFFLKCPWPFTVKDKTLHFGLTQCRYLYIPVVNMLESQDIIYLQNMDGGASFKASNILKTCPWSLGWMTPYTQLDFPCIRSIIRADIIF